MRIILSVSCRRFSNCFAAPGLNQECAADTYSVVPLIATKTIHEDVSLTLQKGNLFHAWGGSSNLNEEARNKQAGVYTVLLSSVHMMHTASACDGKDFTPEGSPNFESQTRL